MWLTSHAHRFALLVLVVGSLGLAAEPATAQYFGPNKVQYKHFRYQVLKTEHFDIYYYPEEKLAVEKAGAMAERWYARLSKLFDHTLTARQPIVLYADHSDFEQTNTIQGQLGEGTGGVTEVVKRRVVLPFAGALEQTDHVLGHELVHAFQYDITDVYSRGGGPPTAVKLPLWFIEGMAEYFSIGPIDPNTAMWLRDGAHRNDLPTVHQLENSQKYFPYRYGQALLAYIGGRWGDQVIGKLLKSAGSSGNIQKAIHDVLGISPEQLSKDWHQAVHEASDPLQAKTQAAEEYGAPLEGGTKENPELNVGPVLSPDGQRMVFFSTRDLFSIDLFLADSHTGKVERKIVNNGLDPHFNSLEFSDSAGAWDPPGRRLALTAVRKGRADLVLLDVAKAHIEREIPFSTVDQIYGATWSPDSRQMAFSAITGGLSDLYTYDLEKAELHRLTNDAYAELQPAWSPDGKSIAFVTDRFDTDLENLTPGHYRLALMDVASRKIEPLPSFRRAKNINPQWSADGKSLYFLSDQNGITNIYRIALANGEIFQLTDLFTGVSGITATSPALSVARNVGKLAFSVYENNQYKIYSADSPKLLSGHPPATLTIEISPAVLPPQSREPGELLSLLEDPATGLPDPSTFKHTEYHPHLSLDYVAQPYLVAGADPFGTFAGGGTSLFWSDMLGEHNLSTMLQVNGGFRDIAGLVGYENRTRRWNWGGAVQRIPYVTGTFTTAVADVDGEPAYVEEVEKLRQTYTAASGIVSYPLSAVHRFEASGGLARISFGDELQTDVYSMVTGQRIAHEKQALPSVDALNLLKGSAALVYDSSLFGATSPILGQRYRLELTPNVGSINFYNVMADYRRYFMPVRPYTLAARVLHYGRYGTDAEDRRMIPLFLGYPNLVRGYDYNSFSADECAADETSSCPQFDRLLGTKMLVGNLELRFPLYGAIRRGRSFYGPLPVEAALFTDAGVAWRGGEKPSFFGGGRKPVASAGVALRVNAFGYAVFEIDYVHPFSRPKKGWYWEFNLISGF